MSLKDRFNKRRSLFEPGGKLHAFRSLFDGFETFFYVPHTTAAPRGDVYVHDAIDGKCVMSTMALALVPALLFGVCNVGLQHFIAIGQTAGFWSIFWSGFLTVLPKIVISYVVGPGIGFAVAQWKYEGIQEGYLVTGMLVPTIVPVDTSLWMIVVAVAMSVIFTKEVLNETGYNIFDMALATRAILFFTYLAAMTGDKIFVCTKPIFSFGGGGDMATAAVDGSSRATPLGQVTTAGDTLPTIVSAMDEPSTLRDAFWGFIPGGIREVSTFTILLGAILLIWTSVASYRVIVSGVVGVALVALLFNTIGTTAAMQLGVTHHLLYGGFAFSLVFMATDPVTSARTETGKRIYGLFVGVMCISIHVPNPSYLEGMMLAILLVSVFVPLIDYVVVNNNISKRKKRWEMTSKY